MRSLAEKVYTDLMARGKDVDLWHIGKAGTYAEESA
jgi:hypothetical protein